MTEQDQNPDITEDTEGHLKRRMASGPDDMEGLDSMDDDAEGHGFHHGVRGDTKRDEDDDAKGRSLKHG